MTDITQESLQKKQEAIDLLTRRYRGMEQRTEDIDLRLRLYFEDLLEHSSAKEDDDNDWHGIYELLGAAKFLRGRVGGIILRISRIKRIYRPRIYTDYHGFILS